MGWSYRRSYKVGPFRINVGSGGVGYSVGGQGFRTGINAHGRRYTSYSVPGTGLRYYKSGQNSRGGCLIVLLLSCALSCIVLPLLVGSFFKG